MNEPEYELIGSAGNTKTYRLGNGRVMDVHGDGQAVVRTDPMEFELHKRQLAGAEEREREERQAWDRYASAVLERRERFYECEVTTGWSEAATIADAMLAERRKRYPAPGAQKGGAA